MNNEKVLTLEQLESLDQKQKDYYLFAAIDSLDSTQVMRAVEAGANIHAREEKMLDTPLHVILKVKTNKNELETKLNIIRFLLYKGAAKGMRTTENKYGTTPFDIAVDNKDETLDLLLDYNSGGKRKTRKSRKSRKATRKAKKTRKH